MKKELIGYEEARETLLARTSPVGTERVPLLESAGRVLAQTLTAAEDVPSFDRSSYDGYALRSADVALASREAPVTLRVIEEIPAGTAPSSALTEGTAAKILTGAPVPEGADAVINFEATEFTAEEVKLFAPLKAGSNIVRAGEDVKRGSVLLRPGMVIDAGAAGVLAAQGVTRPEVYRAPKVAVLSTGSELVEAEADDIAPGKIRNSNAYTLCAALRKYGMEPVYLGIAGDDAGDIAGLIKRGLQDCDAVVSTGGVSVGDYDLTPEAMERAGAEILFRGVAMKPGMACAYGAAGGKLICALSGNPASSLTNFYCIALPALRKLAGHANPLPAGLTVTLRDGFPKPSRGTRLLRGTLDLSRGEAEMLLPGDQGNVVISSAVGADVMAVVPALSGPLEAGTRLQGFLI